MSKTTESLLGGAEFHWPGSGLHFVAIYKCLAAKRRAGLGAAVRISAALRDSEAERLEMPKSLRREVEAMASTREGPKRDRYVAALAALDALDRMTSAASGDRDKRNGA